MKKLLFPLVLALATVTNSLSADTIPPVNLQIKRAHIMSIGEKVDLYPNYASTEAIGAIVFDGEYITIGWSEKDRPVPTEDLIIGERPVKDFKTTRREDGSVWMYEILTEGEDGWLDGLVTIRFTEENGVVVMDPYYDPDGGPNLGCLMYECEVIP